MGDSARCTLVLVGAVDEAVVEQVAGTLAALPPGGALVIDASQASRLEAAVLGRLVRAIRERGGRTTVRIRGLCLHDSRLLGYLGLELDGAPAAPDEGAPEGEPLQRGQPG